jgi:hypothetical protein
MPVLAGQRFSLCAANVGRVNAELTLRFINVRTGAVVASRDVTLPPPGSSGGIPDPCLETTADAVSAPAVTSAEPPLLVALVAIKRGVFARASAATASVQVMVADAAGGYRILASIPLQLATLMIGRNKPIERVP